LRCGLIRAEETIEGPKVLTCWKIAGTATLDVFTNIVFSGVQQPVRLFAWHPQIKGFFHKAIVTAQNHDLATKL